MIATTLKMMDTHTGLEIAREAGISPHNRTPKEVISAAREAFALRAGEYVELHFEGAQVAASKGDTGPAEWALSRIVEQGTRVVDSEKAGATGPSLNIGVMVGGVRGTVDPPVRISISEPMELPEQPIVPTELMP